MQRRRVAGHHGSPDFLPQGHGEGVGGKRTILLPTVAVPVLEELRERNGDTEWVFPGRGREKPRNDYIRRP